MCRASGPWARDCRGAPIECSCRRADIGCRTLALKESRVYGLVFGEGGSAFVSGGARGVLFGAASTQECGVVVALGAFGGSRSLGEGRLDVLGGL